MKKSKLLVGLLIITLASCQNNSTQINQNNPAAQDTIVRHEEEHAQPSNSVSLNNGEKWAANAETTEGINKMAALVSEFPVKPEVEDYDSLKVKLENEFNLIIQKCTMTGEAHEQLHRYLVPMTEMIKKLNSENMEVCRGASEELKQHLDEYKNYFQ